MLSYDDIRKMSTSDLDDLHRMVSNELDIRVGALEGKIDVGSLVVFNQNDGSKVCSLIVNEYDKYADTGSYEDYEYYYGVLNYYISNEGELTLRGMTDIPEYSVGRTLRLSDRQVTIYETNLKEYTYKRMLEEMQFRLIKELKVEGRTHEQ